jgi:MFS transporter, PAT family, beta-lactamase induction signal transducer AmpG
MSTYQSSINTRSPWIFIPTLYLAEGLPYIIVINVSIVMFKEMGLSNEQIGLTRFLYLPWIIKMFWGPIVDLYSTKRTWILINQIILFCAFALLAATMHMSIFLPLSLVLLFATAFSSATHDIAIDGYYMLSLKDEQQALFVGVRSTFYRLAMILGYGVLVVIAGKVGKASGNIPFSWTVYFSIAAIIFLALAAFHWFYLPRPKSDKLSENRINYKSYLQVFKTYFQQPRIFTVVLFILLYRLGEAILGTMSAPFMLDSVDKGGLGLDKESVGFIFGTVGIISLVIGGILGGWLISRFGIKKCLWPMALMLKAPDFVYVYMASTKPALSKIYGLVALEQFGYGVGFTAFMVVLMYITEEKYKTSHFAISTGIMALGMMVPGMVSGYLQSSLGYLNFFILVLCLTIPGLLVLFFVPLENRK